MFAFFGHRRKGAPTVKNALKDGRYTAEAIATQTVQS
jgi:hypothetical protein